MSLGSNSDWIFCFQKKYRSRELYVFMYGYVNVTEYNFKTLETTSNADKKGQNSEIDEIGHIRVMGL